MKKLILFLLPAILVISCYHIAPAPSFNNVLVIPADSMVSVLVDLHLAEGMANIEHKNGKALEHISGEYFHTVLEKHDIKLESFDESIRYYSYHTEEMDKIYEQVIIQLSKLESLVNQPKSDSDTLTLSK